MSGSEPWLLPAGIEEVLPGEAARLEQARRSVIDLLSSWGYELVIPPLIEYLPSLLTGTGGDLDLQTFKLTDQLTGRLMGIRADMTPQVARIDAHHMKRDVPVRLCYLGTVLHTRPNGFSGSRSFLQVGAELYGHQGIESDVEILCLMLETMAVAGVQQVHLDIGHVGIYRGLAQQAALTAEQEITLFDALQRKARSELDELLASFRVAVAVAAMLRGLIDLHGGEDVLRRAAACLAQASDPVREGLERLAALAGQLHRWVPHVPLHFDLAELRGYRYHTGVVFAAFVPGHGQEIARGGRYDDIGSLFGRSRPATGFSTDLKTLVALAGEPPEGASRAGAILAPYADDVSLGRKVAGLRASGERVIYALPRQTARPWELGCDRVLVWDGAQWALLPASRLSASAAPDE